MAKKSPRKAAMPATVLLIATRKGLWVLAGDAKRATWKLRGPHFLGHIVHHAVLDPRDGKTWQRQDKGFPAEQAWWTVKRQAMTADGHDVLGLYFGTTSGEICGSKNEGASWKCLASHLPHVYAVEACAWR